VLVVKEIGWSYSLDPGEGSDVAQMYQDNFLAVPKRSLGLKERVPELLLFRFSELIKR